MNVNLEMKISPNFNVSDWIQARDSQNWQRMVDIFSDRLKGRFLEPIRLIAEDKIIGEFSGFSIIALDCLIIETLMQFYNGISETKFRKVEKAFVNFLTQSGYFKDDFNKDTAKTFYDHFRNGLLHQAQTKEKSLIQIKPKNMVTEIEGGLIINRRLFHNALINEINSYKDKLLNSENNNDLRVKFKLKMDMICHCT